MSNHDQLCPHREFIPGDGPWIEGFSDPPKPVQCYEPCQCDLIVQVRADERQRCVDELRTMEWGAHSVEWADGWIAAMKVVLRPLGVEAKR